MGQVADLQQEVVALRGELKDASAEMVAAAIPTSRPRSARTKVRSVSQPSLGIGEEARADNLGRNGNIEDDAAAWATNKRLHAKVLALRKQLQSKIEAATE